MSGAQKVLYNVSYYLYLSASQDRPSSPVRLGHSLFLSPTLNFCLTVFKIKSSSPFSFLSPSSIISDNYHLLNICYMLVTFQVFF